MWICAVPCNQQDFHLDYMHALADRVCQELPTCEHTPKHPYQTQHISSFQLPLEV